MQTLLDYALAFGADIGAAKILQWTTVSNGHQHGQLNCQLIAHHYCSHFNQDVRQCILFMNSDRPDKQPIVHIPPPLFDVSPPLFDSSPPLLDASSPLLDASSPLLDATPPLLDATPPLSNNKQISK
ncbi:unnamed protein product, partial [Rotaria sp. Silwood1]